MKGIIQTAEVEISSNKAPAYAKSSLLNWAALLVRWVLGGLFLYMGLNKALHPVEFLKMVREYHTVTEPLLLNSVAAFLPWFEVFCGLLLLVGVAVRGTALMLLAMLLPFTLVVLKRALALSAAQGIPLCAVKFDCGCGTGEVIICHKLLTNSVLMLLALWLVTWRRGCLCLRFALSRKARLETSGSND